MALTINTNISSLMVQLSLKQSSLELDRALQQMTTGYRINSAKDDAAGYAVASKMAIDLSSYGVAQNNAMLGTSLLGTATSSLDLVTTHLQRMRDLAEQAANGTYGNDSIAAIQAEINQRTEEINRVMSTTEYNGIKLFEGDGTNTISTISTFSSPRAVTVDESKRVVNQTTFQSGETYYLTTSDDLVKLQDLVNSGVDTTNVTFELANDIDMQGVTFRGIGIGGGDISNVDFSKVFKGTFNGNQHVISITINTSEEGVGLFVIVYGGNIDSLGVENADISGTTGVGGLAVAVSNGTISTSYFTGSVSGDEYVGGLAGIILYGTINNSYSTGSVSGYEGVGGLAGYIEYGTINNSYSTGSVSGTNYVGGFAGIILGTINNSYATGSVSGTNYVGGLVGYGDGTINGYYDKNKTGQTVGIADGSYTGIVTGVTSSELQNLINNGTLPKYDYEFNYGGGGTAGGGNGGNNNTGREFTLQIGIDSTENSKISFDTALGFTLNIDVSTTTAAQNALDEIDAVLDLITAKQTEFGAVQNRLDSVLDSLNVSIQNTTSSLSTIRDADIAKVSSEYIRAQILQQASSSLLATANQSPSIALNLI